MHFCTNAAECQAATHARRRYPVGVPRIARFVCPGLPHHVTQRGNRRAQVFFSDADHQTYLALLREYTTRHQVAVLAYCLMSNHVHLVLLPAARDSLQLALRHLHVRYAQRINRAMSWRGHVFQGRYFASALDERHRWAAIRYVERNPVRAGMVERAEDYPWSSAAAHCGLRNDTVLTDDCDWQGQVAGVGNWSAWLAEGDEDRELRVLRAHASKGLPCGSDEFIDRLESTSGRCLRRVQRAKRMRPL
jgi:putative transposase